MFSKLMNSYYYGKSGKGDYRREDLPKNRWQLFWEMLRIRFSGICRINLMTCVAWIPTMIVLVILANAVLTCSDITTMTDENGRAYTALVYAAQTDEAGNVISEETSVPLQGVLQISLLMLIPCQLILGPIQAGLAYVTRNWARDEHAFPWGDFKDAVKDNWKQALGVSAITAILPFVLYICYIFYNQMQLQSRFYLLPQMLTLVLGLLWYLGLVFMYPLLITYKMTFRELIRNGIMLAVARLPMTIGVRLATLMPAIIVLAVIFFTGSWLVPLMLLALYYIVLGNALARFVYASFTNGVFDRFINSKIEGVEINRGLAKEEDEDFTEEDEPQDEPPAAPQA